MNLEAFDLNLLKALVAIYEERQITAAADRLGISQPGLSHALGRLRGHFDDELFVRHHGEMVPTATAEDLYARAGAGLRMLQDGFAAPARFEPATLERTFVLGMNDYGAHVILPPLIRSMAAVAPKVRLKTRHYAHGTQYDDLRRGNIELSITVDGEMPGWVASMALFEETALVVADAANPLLVNGLDLDTYIRCPHVIMAPDGGDRNWVDDALEDIGHTRTVQHTVPHFLAVPPIIRGTTMISTVPRRIAEALGRADGLTTYPLPIPSPPHRIVQAWPNRLDRNPLHCWLREQVAKVAEALD